MAFFKFIVSLGDSLVQRWRFGSNAEMDIFILFDQLSRERKTEDDDDQY